MFRTRITQILLIAGFLFGCSFAFSQPDEIAEAPAENPANFSPRDTVRLMLSAISEQDIQALRANFDTRPSMELRNINVGELLARFPALLDGYGQLLPMGVLSNSSTGTEEINLSASMERVGEIRINSNVIPIILERVEQDSEDARWLVSQLTTIELSTITSDLILPRINEYLPQSLLARGWRGAPLGQWLAMPVIVLLSVLVGWLLASVLRQTAVALTEKKPDSQRAFIVRALAVPIAMVLGVFVFLWIERFLGISILIRQDFSVLTISLLWIALFVFLWSMLDRLSAHSEKVLRAKNRAGSLSLVIFFRAAAKVSIFILAAILVLDSNGFDVSTGLAALGIGGLALALGAQKAIENIVGSVIVVVDQPFRVGDFCKVGDMMGTIEHIGLRSTRIRTLNDTLVTFPNGVLSSERIENYTMRRKFLLRTTLTLRYETRIEDLEKVLEGLRDYLYKSEYVSPEGLRVRFIEYGAASLNVEVFAYFFAKDYAQFLERQEPVLLAMSKIIQENGSGFAFPSQTLYFNRDSKPKPLIEAVEQA